MVDTDVAWFAHRQSSLSLKPVYLSTCAWKALTITFDALKVSVQDIINNASQLPQKESPSFQNVLPLIK